MEEMNINGENIDFNSLSTVELKNILEKINKDKNNINTEIDNIIMKINQK